MTSQNEDISAKDTLVEKWIQGFHRGSLRFFILHLLLHEREQKNTNSNEFSFRRKIHGYHIAKVIKRITDGRWHPKTASIYPILKQFEEEGIIKEIMDSNNSEGKRFAKKYQLTDYGVTVAQKLEAARKEFVKAFRIHPPHKTSHPPPFHFMKSRLDLTKIEVLAILQNTSSDELKKEKEHLTKSILSIQNVIEVIDKEIERRNNL